ncbi:MAG: sugar kinase [Candidatus Cloacimonetes bacterium]|nr:sugar kinase [Candidatus Cloacimonadota bacterium]
MSLIIVGSVALDSVKTPYGEAEEVRGGSAVYASMWSRHFCTTRIVGVVGSDFPQKHLNMLKEAGIDLEGLEIADGETFRWVGEYDNLNVAETKDTLLNVFADFSPKLPESYRNCDLLFLGNIDPVLQMQVMDYVNACLIAVDTMNFWISSKKAELLKVLSKADIIFINEEEVKQLTGKRNVFDAAKAALEIGGKYIIVKQGSYGAMAVGHDFLFFLPVYPIYKVVDPTGAGDSFAGGFLGYIAESKKLDHSIMKKAMLYGTVTASFDIQDFSLAGVKSVTRQEIDQRVEELVGYLTLD